MVGKIIDGQVAEGLLREAPISFRDVETIKQLFVERLRTAYHMRVAYPENVKREAPQTPDNGDTADDMTSDAAK